MVYCLVPRDLAPKLHEALRRHFRGDPGIEVIVERRDSDRRQLPERRTTIDADRSPKSERRRVVGAAGRRVAEQRAPVVALAAPSLPRKVLAHAAGLTFVERLEPSTEEAEDRDTARLVARFQAGDEEVFALLYARYFDRVYGYVRLLLHQAGEAEDVTQQVFLKLLSALAGYERREQPFRAWLFVIVRNHALSHLRTTGRLEPVDPLELNRRLDATAYDPPLDALQWVSDRELLLLVERLPLAQRQVLMLRYMLDLTPTEIGGVLGRAPGDVRILQHRALAFLRERLTSLGRDSKRLGRQASMRRGVHEAVVLRSRRFALAR
ncbi:MAG TPA: sigma-70 family RNA polymerase sigma factor [Solirubrobacteraceae bacterium]|nr:sigma-70 family RNA polymerase sigma factor [Solirubrobacteraceae bacterium]